MGEFGVQSRRVVGIEEKLLNGLLTEQGQELSPNG